MKELVLSGRRSFFNPSDSDRDLCPSSTRAVAATQSLGSLAATRNLPTSYARVASPRARSRAYRASFRKREWVDSKGRTLFPKEAPEVKLLPFFREDARPPPEVKLPEGSELVPILREASPLAAF